MNLFFSPPVYTYSILVPHHQACGIVDQLISMACVQFQLIPYEDSSDPFYLIFSRIRQLKYRLSGLIENIEHKYKEEKVQLSKEERILIVGRMKEFIEDRGIDYLSYLDMQQNVINEKISKFNGMANNYDSIESNITALQQQIDTLRVKRTITKNFSTQQFSIISGICQKTTKNIIEKIVFRKTHGHCYMMFKERQSDRTRDVFILFINKKVFKNIQTKIKNIFSINKVNVYQLPSLDQHLQDYQNKLLSRKEQYQKLLDVSSLQFLRQLKDCVSNGDISLQHHLVRLTFLQRIVYIICHSKHIGSPSNHTMFTIHIPSTQPLPQLPMSIIPIHKKYKQRTIMPRLPCLFETNILTQLFSTPLYNQILPSAFMFSTVPILFGMMFSDMGHGIILLAISFFMKLGPLFIL